MRAADDYAKGHIPGDVNLPKDRWSSLQGLRKDRAVSAAVRFAGEGFPVMELDGGWRWWKNDGFDVET